MHYRDEDAFAKALKGDKPRGLYLLYGSEPYLIESWAKRLIKPFAGDFSSFNLQKLDGRRLDADELFDAVETLPLMAQEKCVLLEDLDIKGLPPAEMDKLTQVLEDVPESCLLVITAKPGVFDPKSAAAKKLLKLCGEAGTAVELGARSQGGLVSFLKSAAKKGGCELSTDLARYILQTCETDMASLRGEMEKICAYAGQGALTRAHVDAVAVARTEARVFDLGKAILAGNPQRAFQLMADLFYLREQPVAIVAVLAMSYADLYRARVAKESGRTAAEVVALFGYKGREFRVNNAWNSRISTRALRDCILALQDCDRKMKSTGVDAGILLEQTVVQLFVLQERG